MPRRRKFLRTASWPWSSPRAESGMTAFARPSADASMAPEALAAILLALTTALALLGLAAGSEGWSFAWLKEWDLVAAIRAPRTLGALLTGVIANVMAPVTVSAPSETEKLRLSEVLSAPRCT